MSNSLPLSTFLNNFTSIFIDSLNNMLARLETDPENMRKNTIQDWAKSSKDFVNYSKSIVTFAQGNNSSYKKIVVNHKLIIDL